MGIVCSNQNKHLCRLPLINTIYSMRKLLLITFVSVVACISSCKKSSKNDEKSDNPFGLEYSNLTTEEHKKEIEQAGVEFVQEFNSLPDEKSISVLNYFASLGLSLNEEVASVSSTLTISKHASEKNVAGILAAVNNDDVGKLSDSYGIFEWSANESAWNEIPSTEKLEFRFPSEEGKATNNAILTFSYVKDKDYTIDGEKVELPKSSTATLKVDGKTELTWTSSHEYKADGTPTKTSTSVTIGAFILASNTNNDGNNVSSGFSLKKGSKQLLAANLSGESTATVTNVNNEEDVENLIKNANADFTVMNFKFIGQANIKEIIKEIDVISGDNAGQKEAAVWNKHSQLVAVNTKDNSLIAKVEFQGSDERECYKYPVWDPNQGKYVDQENCWNYSSVDPLLVFKDGSKQSIDAFAENGFNKIVDELESLIEKFD